MTARGFDFGQSGIVAEWAKMKRKRSGPVALTFLNVLTARAFHFQFKNHEWESNDCTQVIMVQLHHDAFDSEMQSPHVRTMVETCTSITPEMIRSITGSITS